MHSNTSRMLDFIHFEGNIYEWVNRKKRKKNSDFCPSLNGKIILNIFLIEVNL